MYADADFCRYADNGLLVYRQIESTLELMTPNNNVHIIYCRHASDSFANQLEFIDRKTILNDCRYFFDPKAKGNDFIQLIGTSYKTNICFTYVSYNYRAQVVSIKIKQRERQTG